MRVPRLSPQSIGVLALASALAASSASAQTGLLSGFVAADSSGNARLANAEVSIPALRMTGRTSWLGEYRIGPIPAGRYLVSVRQVGYTNYQDSIIVAGNELRRDFVLVKPPIVLDSVVANATAPRKWVSPALNAFEERRKTNGGGYFITDSVLRRVEDRALGDVLRGQASGLTFMHGGGDRVYLYSTRNNKQGKCVMCTNSGKKPAEDPRLVPACYATVYLDGLLLYDLEKNGSSTAPPNINDFRVDQLGAVEFYAGEGALPPQYKASGCGTLLLWTREK